MIKFVAHNHEHNCDGSDSFWNEDTLEPVNKDPTFPKMPKTRGKPSSPEYRALHNIARRLRPLVRASLVRGINAFKGHIDLNDLAEALSEGNVAAALDSVPWEDFPEAIKGLEKVTLEGVADSAEASKHLFRNAIDKVVGVKPDITFDANNPGVRAWVQGHLGELIQNIRTGTQRSIQNVMMDAMNRGLPPRESAKLISQMVGLNDRQAKAVMNRRMALKKKGISGPKLDQLLEDYTQKQLKYRGELIARTEAMTANNRGMLEVMEQNANKGLFDRSKAKKKWIVTPYDRLCPVCRPMKNKMVGMDENFRLRNGKSIPHPPAHPNCNCSWSIELPDDAF